MRTLGKTVVLSLVTVIVAPMLLGYLTRRGANSASRMRIVALRRLIPDRY
jgi:ACR3 family arsenite efflux pump ArsB